MMRTTTKEEYGKAMMIYLENIKHSNYFIQNEDSRLREVGIVYRDGYTDNRHLEVHWS